MALRRSRDLPGRDRESVLTLDEVRAKHPQWIIERSGLDLMCRYGAWRFLAEDPDDVEREIVRRERPMSLEEITAVRAAAGLHDH